MCLVKHKGPLKLNNTWIRKTKFIKCKIPDVPNEYEPKGLESLQERGEYYKSTLYGAHGKPIN
jgi:hypothetical protein